MSLPRILLLFVLCLSGIVALLLWSGKTPEQEVTSWPWQIETLPEGKSRVFGLTLPESSLQQATETFRNLPEVAVFRSASGNYSLEAYFDRLELGSLRAKAVLRLEPGDTDLQQLFESGSKPKPQKSGEWRVALGDDRKTALAGATIAALTYLPAAQLDAAIIETRFGQPAQILTVTESRSHWLYPDRGLVITQDDDEKEVLQYVAPKDFDALLTMVKRSMKEANSPEP